MMSHGRWKRALPGPGKKINKEDSLEGQEGKSTEQFVVIEMTNGKVHLESNGQAIEDQG